MNIETGQNRIGCARIPMPLFLMADDSETQKQRKGFMSNDLKQKFNPEHTRGEKLVLRLRKLMEKKGLTQDAVARGIPVSWVTISRYMRDLSVPMRFYADAVEKFLTKNGG